LIVQVLTFEIYSSRRVEVVSKGHSPVDRFHRSKSTTSWQQVGNFSVYGEATGWSV